jgi:hypothetical protein
MTETPSQNEASKQLARGLLIEGVSIEEVMAKSGLSKPACLGLKGSLVKASKRLVQGSKPAYNQPKPSQAFPKPEIEFQAQDQPEPPMSLASPMSPYIHLDTQGLIAFRESLTKPQQKMLDAYMTLGERKWQQEVERNNGHGPIRYYNNDGHEENPHLKKVQQILEARAEAKDLKKLYGLDDSGSDIDRKLEKLEDKIDRTMERLASPRSEGNVEKAIDALGKVYQQAATSSQGPNPYQIAESIISLTKEQAQLARGATNEMDLKKEEMRELHDIELRKLSWEVEKWKEQRQSTADTINAIKDILSGPIGGMIKTAGGWTARRIEGRAAPPTIMNVDCPKCHKPFPGIEGSANLVCPRCNSILTLIKLEPEVPQPLAQEPENAQPQQEVQETETKAQETEEIHRPQQEAQPTETHETKPTDKSLIGSREDPWA